MCDGELQLVMASQNLSTIYFWVFHSQVVASVHKIPTSPKIISWCQFHSPAHSSHFLSHIFLSLFKKIAQKWEEEPKQKGGGGILPNLLRRE